VRLRLAAPIRPTDAPRAVIRIWSNLARRWQVQVSKGMIGSRSKLAYLLHALRPMTLLAVIVTCSLTIHELYFRSWPMPFDSAAWKQDSRAAFCSRDILSARRDRMVADLLRRHPLVGLHVSQVKDLLGEPDVRCKEGFGDWDMGYWLGPDVRGFVGALDFKWLVLRIDTNGNISQCKVITD